MIMLVPGLASGVETSGGTPPHNQLIYLIIG